MEKTKKINNRIKTSVSRKIFVVVNVILLILLSFIFVFPYINIVAKAFNDAADTALGGITIFPRKFTFDNFGIVFADNTLMRSMLITVIRVVVGTLWSLLVTYAAAYALLQKRLWGKGMIIGILTLPMFINGGLISNLIIYSRVLHVYDTFFVYVLPNAFSFFYMVVIRTYLQGLSDSYREAARIDGAGEIAVMFKIYLPLSMPIVATMCLWIAVGYWNDYSTSLYYIKNPNLYTMQYVLQLSLKQAEQINSIISSAIASGRPIGNVDALSSGDAIQAVQIVVTTVPILLLYPFLQKYFIKGVSLGGVKE